MIRLLCTLTIGLLAGTVAGLYLADIRPRRGLLSGSLLFFCFSP